MKTFTKEQTDALMCQAKTMLEGIGENQSVRDIMAKHYAENLDEKTLIQGQVMADAILDAVRDFDADYRNAVEDMDGYIRKFQKKADEGKSCVERCNYWLRLAGALSAAGQVLADSEADREQILKQLDSLTISEEDATPDLEEQLRRKAREAMKESGILLTGVMANPEALEEITQADEAAELLIDLGNEEIEYRALVAMLAYTDVKTGRMDNIPVDMTAVQMTHLVCAQVEQTRILDAVGRNYTMEVAELLLYALGVVVQVKVFVPLLSLAITAATEMFGVILFIPAMMMIVGLYLYVFRKALHLWEKECSYIIKNASIAVNRIFKGLQEMASYVKTSVLPVIKEKCKAIFVFLAKLVSKPKTEVHTAEGEIVEEDEEIFVDMDDDLEVSGQENAPKCIALT